MPRSSAGKGKDPVHTRVSRVLRKLVKEVGKDDAKLQDVWRDTLETLPPETQEQLYKILEDASSHALGKTSVSGKKKSKKKRSDFTVVHMAKVIMERAKKAAGENRAAALNPRTAVVPVEYGYGADISDLDANQLADKFHEMEKAVSNVGLLSNYIYKDQGRVLTHLKVKCGNQQEFQQVCAEKNIAIRTAYDRIRYFTWTMLAPAFLGNKDTAILYTGVRNLFTQLGKLYTVLSDEDKSLLMTRDTNIRLEFGTFAIQDFDSIDTEMVAGDGEYYQPLWGNELPVGKRTVVAAPPTVPEMEYTDEQLGDSFFLPGAEERMKDLAELTMNANTTNLVWDSSAERPITPDASSQSSTAGLTSAAADLTVNGDDDVQVLVGLLQVPGLQDFENKEISIELQAQDLLSEILELLLLEVGDTDFTFSKDNFNVAYGTFTDGLWQVDGAVSWDTVVSQTTSKSFVVMPTMGGAAELFQRKFKDEERRLLQQRGILDYTGPTKVQVIIKEVPVPERGGLSKADADIVIAERDLLVQQIKLFEMQSVKLRQEVARKLPDRDAPQDGRGFKTQDYYYKLSSVVKGQYKPDASENPTKARLQRKFEERQRKAEQGKKKKQESKKQGDAPQDGRGWYSGKEFEYYSRHPSAVNQKYRQDASENPTKARLQRKLEQRRKADEEKKKQESKKQDDTDELVKGLGGLTTGELQAAVRLYKNRGSTTETQDSAIGGHAGHLPPGPKTTGPEMQTYLQGEKDKLLRTPMVFTPEDENLAKDRGTGNGAGLGVAVSANNAGDGPTYDMDTCVDLMQDERHYTAKYHLNPKKNITKTYACTERPTCTKG